jgi:hypothetical protein
VTGPADRVTAADRCDQDTSHQRRQEQARDGRAVTVHVLQIQRQVGDRTEQSDADDEAHCAGDGDDAFAEDRRRQDRLRGPGLDEHEPDQQDHTEHDQHDQRRRAPWVAGAAKAGEQHDPRQASGQQRRAEVVDLVSDAGGARLEYRRDHGQRHQPDRQVDVEDPLPGEVVDAALGTGGAMGIAIMAMVDR